VDFLQSRSKTVEIQRRTRVTQIDIVGRQWRAMQRGSLTTDNNEIDAMSLKQVNDAY
jgi:hypothetical protein